VAGEFLPLARVKEINAAGHRHKSGGLTAVVGPPQPTVAELRGYWRTARDLWSRL